jgi:hypothetical protein
LRNALGQTVLLDDLKLLPHCVDIGQKPGLMDKVKVHILEAELQEDDISRLVVPQENTHVRQTLPNRSLDVAETVFRGDIQVRPGQTAIVDHVSNVLCGEY